MFTFEFNGESCEKHGLKVVTRPSIPAPVKRRNTTVIAGRDGVLVTSDGSYEPITFPIEMNFIGKESEWGARYREAKRWLKGNGTLKFSDDQDYFLKVLYVDIELTERLSKKIGRFEVSVTCDPYMYAVSGVEQYDINDVLYNPYMRSKPTYKITGEGNGSLTVNDSIMTFNVANNLTIDTERMIAYREDGTVVNSDITGNYDELYLNEGDNTISISSGLTLKVIPNWRTL